MAKGFKELVLIPALTEQKFTSREARAVIDAIFDSVKDALRRHESVELPIGNFAVLQNPQERAQRSEKVIELRKYQVDFLPSNAPELAVPAVPPSLPRPQRKKKLIQREPPKSEPTKDELTLSAELIANFIRSNVQAGNWSLFFDELSIGPSIPAMFERARPKSHELRPLNEAAQVIEECAPKEMPEEPWGHLYACLEWFARWSQRAIPKAVWQEALQQAKKTLLPRDSIRTLDGR
jgi:nucleoid DNA-binding protein